MILWSGAVTPSLMLIPVLSMSDLADALRGALVTFAKPLLLAYVASWIALYAHEIGHATAARLLGIRIWGIRLGVGPPLFDGSLAGCRLRIGLFPLVGSVILLDADASAIGYRDIQPGPWRFEWGRGAWRAPVISASGGVSNLLVSLLAVVYWYLAGSPRLGTPVGDLFVYTFVANLSGYLNLFPLFSSDGQHLLAHVTAARRVGRSVPARSRTKAAATGDH
jgi:membrane-associated protease RseP (regulator of RpoE activity)